MYRFRRFPALMMALVLALAPAAGCGGGAGTEAISLNISAAASLTDAVGELNALYTERRPSVAITANFASSGTIQQQIQNGAPCDVFISAAVIHMVYLQSGGLLLEGSRRDLLRNRLVLIAPSGSALTGFSDLTRDSVKRIAIGDPGSVPVGKYAEEALDALGLESVTPKLVLASDARQVLAYVETGNVEAGIVFVTDALISQKVRIVASAPEEINAKILYPVAVIKTSRQQAEAKKYIEFLFSTQAKEVFRKYGFSVVE